MKLLDQDEIKFHIEGLLEWEDWRKKCFGFRKLVVGDLSDVANSNIRKQKSKVTKSRPTRSQTGRGMFGAFGSADIYNIDVRDFEAFQTNKLFDTLRVLVLQTSFKVPQFTFSGLDHDDAAWHAEYARTRLGSAPRGAEFGEVMHLAGWDTMITGVGATMLTMQFVGDSGWPKPQYIQSERVGWDKTSGTVGQSKWRTAIVERSVEDIEASFGKDAVSKALKDFHTDLKGRDVVACLYYYNTQHDTAAVWVVDVTGRPVGSPLYHGQNPFYVELDDQRYSIQPIQLNCPIQIGGVEFPMGAVELAARYQLDFLDSQERARSDYDQARTVRVWNLQNMTDKSKREVLAGRKTVRDIFTESGDPRTVLATVNGGTGISRDHIAMMAQAESSLKQSIGVTGYSLGSTEGVDFAVEANMISQQAGLVAAHYLAESASYHCRVCQTFLSASAEFDTGNLTLRVDGLEYPHGVGVSSDGVERIGPPGMYIRPDVAVNVEEDTLMYQSRTQKMGEQLQLLGQLAPFSGQYPQLAEKLLEDALAAAGKPASMYLVKAPVMGMAPGMDSSGLQ